MPIYHLLYRSATAAAVPQAVNMPPGRLAVNTTDERLFFRNTAGTVVEPVPRSHTHPVSQVTGLQTTLDTHTTQLAAVLGVSQSFQNVGAGRAVDTIYTNSTGRPIIVQVSLLTSAADSSLITYVDERVAQRCYNPVNGATVATQVTVPAGSTYRQVIVGGGTISAWWEYR